MIFVSVPWNGTITLLYAGRSKTYFFDNESRKSYDPTCTGNGRTKRDKEAAADAGPPVGRIRRHFESDVAGNSHPAHHGGSRPGSGCGPVAAVRLHAGQRYHDSRHGIPHRQIYDEKTLFHSTHSVRDWYSCLRQCTELHHTHARQDTAGFRCRHHYAADADDPVPGLSAGE